MCILESEGKLVPLGPGGEYDEYQLIEPCFPGLEFSTKLEEKLLRKQLVRHQQMFPGGRMFCK